MKLNLNKEAGFTLLEALVALSLSAMILLLFTSSFIQTKAISDTIVTDSQNLAYQNKNIRGDRQIEWHIFLNQLEQQLTNTELVDFKVDEFTVQEWNEAHTKKETVRYHRTSGGTRSFRRSKSNGHNAMLMDIEKMNFIKNKTCLFLNITFRNGENYRGRIWIESWEEDSE